MKERDVDKPEAEEPVAEVNRYGSPKRSRPGRPNERDVLSKERELNYGITRKERLLVDSMIANPTLGKAAIYRDVIGAKNSNAGSVLAERALADPRVQRYYNNQVEQQMARTHVRQDSVLAELTALGLFDVRTLFDDDGGLLPIEDWPVEAGHAISSFNIKEVRDDEGNLRGRDISIKLWDKVRSLELLGKHLRLFVENPAPGTEEAKEQIMDRIGKLTTELSQRGLLPTIPTDDSPEIKPGQEESDPAADS